LISSLGLLTIPFYNGSVNSDKTAVLILDRSERQPNLNAATVTIHIAGEVVAPGVYEVPADATVAEILAHVKLTPHANLNTLNLSSVVQENDRLMIKAKKHSRSAALRNPISINHGSRAALISVPGIGPKMADRIIAHRNKNGLFTAIVELKKVNGIGEKTLSRLRPYLSL